MTTVEGTTSTLTTIHHMVAMPYPGRGHINPMLNLCILLFSTAPDLLITFVVTEEWLGFLQAEPTPPQLRFRALPQVIPSESGRGADWAAFFEATVTRLQAPFEQLMEELEPPPSVILYDTNLMWVVGVGNKRNIPVASMFPMSASVFTVLFHFDLLVQNGHFPPESEALEQADEHVDYIPGLPPTTLSDLPTFFHGPGRKGLPRVLETMSEVLKAQYLLLTSLNELEGQVIDTFKTKLSIPIYHIGPMIPHFKLEMSHNINDQSYTYFKWLDSQPKDSVLYVSMGSFLSISSTQMDETVAGIRDSGVRYLWVTRGDSSRFKQTSIFSKTSDKTGRKDTDGNELGYFVPWCDQLKVLCHPSVGGFLTHCGWNSVSEGIYAGVPMLTFPIFWDQMPNSKMIVEDWKIGWRVRKKNTNGGMESLATRKEISEIVGVFMDSDGIERKEMVKRAERLREIFRGAVRDGGSARADLNAFVNAIL